MRRMVLLAAFILSSAFGTRAQAPNAVPKPGAGETNPSVAPKPIRVPLFFEANQGQTDSRVRFLTRSSGYTLFMTPTETVLEEASTHMGGSKRAFGASLDFRSVPAGALRMQLIGANPAPTMTGNEELPGKLNYLMGNDPAQWHTGVPLFSRVQIKQVYPGVNLVFHGNDRALEYDFVVAPGADPSQVAFRIRGAKRIEIDSHGDLVLHTAASEFRMHKPVIYQADGTSRRAIEGGFILSAKNEVRFQLGDYDRSQPLVIDPTIGFASFLGGAGIDIGGGFVVDDSTAGSPKLYLSGETFDSTTFPEPNTVIGSGTSTTAPAVAEVGFVAKIDPTATGAASLIYLTFIGGKVPFQAADNGCLSAVIWLALDKTQGAANVQPVLGAETNCSDYPTTTVINAVTAPSQSDSAVVATRLTASGAAVDKSAMIGGNDQVTGSFVSVGVGGEVLIAGATSATNLPVMNPYVGTLNNGNAGFADCFVAKLERSDLAATYLTYTNTGGGSTKVKSSGCGAFDDATGNILAGGNTVSATAFNLGTGGASLANGFEQTFPANATDATWAIKLNPNLSGTNQLVFATYFAGGGMTTATNGAFDLGNGVVAIVGRTNSNTAVGDIPLKNAFQIQNKAAATNGQTGYLIVFDTSQTGAASLLCSTYFGGSSGKDIIGGVGYDAGDPTNFRILLSGQTSSIDFPVLHEIQPYVGASGSPDAFVSVLNVPLPSQAFAANLVFSTYIGGSNPPAQVNTVPPTIIEDDRISGIGVDANHTIYAMGTSNSPQGFFANTNPATTVNGFQTTCTSCSGATAFDDVVIFSIKTGGAATLNSIAVTPTAATIPTGQTQQFQAVGNFNDGTEQDITSQVAWTTVPGGIATMSIVTPGLATGVAAGVTAVTPTFGATPILNTGALTVTGNAVATHFMVSAPPAATAGTAFNFTVTAKDAANNTVTTYGGTVNFSSTDGAATLPANDVGLTNGVGNFLATLRTAGPQTITATDTVTASINGTSSTITVSTVTGPTLVSIDISPTNPTLAPGQVLQLSAQGNFSDGSTQNLTTSSMWVSSDQNVATVSNASGTQGQLTGIGGGTVTISATSAGVTGQAFSTVGSNPFMVPPQLFFTEPTLGTQTPSQTTAFTNPGPGAVQINTITLTGSFPGDFIENHDCNQNVLASGTCPINASFKPTGLGPRTADVSVASNSPFSPTVAHLTGNGTMRQLAGFTSNVLLPNDDGSTINPVTLPFSINFFGTTFNSLFVNNNGNVTFGQALSTFTPTGLNGNNGGIPIIAPFWADVDTTGAGSSVVTYGNDTVNGRAAFGVDYQNVGYFASNFDKLNSFQVVLIDRSDTGAGNFDMEFNFDKIQWEVGDASGGAGGLCGTLPACTPAAVGYSNGTGNPGTNFQLAGSFVAGALLDGGPAATSLIANDLNNPTLGRYLFSVRNGVVQADTLTLTLAGTGTGKVKDNTGQLNCSDTNGGQRICVANYPSGTPLILTATADTGSSFTGWSTPCSGTGTCAFTITQDTSVTGTFTSGTVTLQSITVAPATASIVAGVTQAFTATGHFSDGSTGPVAVTWSSGNTAIATINAATGVATGVTAGGPVTITATSTQTPAINGTSQLTVTGPVVLVSIAVTPANPTVVVGQNQQFTATGSFSDHSTQDLTASVVWGSSNTNAASITAGGLATGLTGGTNTTISATKALGATNIVGTTTLTVTTVPFVLTITPPPGGNPGAPPTVSPGGTLAIGLTLTATPGFNGTVNFSCVSNAPQFLTCTPAPSSVTLSGNTSKQVALVMHTFCQAETPIYGPGPGGFGGGLALLLAAAMLGSLTWAFRTRSRWALSFAVLMLIALGSAACSSPPGGPSGRTPAGTYTLSITASVAGGASQTVQQQIQVTR